LHQEDDFELLNLPQALNSHKATSSGRKIENLLPLPFFAIFSMSSLNPTTFKSKDFLSTATNLSQPPFIAQGTASGSGKDNPETTSTSGLSASKGKENCYPRGFWQDSGDRKRCRWQEHRRENYWRRQKLPVDQAHTPPEQEFQQSHKDLRKT